MLDMQALERAFGVIEEIGQDELVFEVGDTTVALRVMLPLEEVAVQRYAQEALQGQDEKADRHAAMEYLDRFKIEVLAYSLVQIGDLDLRGVSFIDTGETTKGGQPIKRPKHEVLRKLISKRWTRPILTSLFRKYGEVVEGVEIRSEGAIEFEPADLDTEIQRLEERLEELKSAKEEQGKKLPDMVAEQFKRVQSHAQEVQEQERDQASQVSDIKAKQQASRESESSVDRAESSVDRAEPSVQRTPTIPRRAVPPTRDIPEDPPQPAPGVPSQDSFGDSDEDLALEHQRLLEARRKIMRERESTSAQDAASTKRPRRTPPHRQAANTTNSVMDTGAGKLAAARPVGKVDGKEAFRLPSQNIDPRGLERGRGEPDKPLDVNAVPEGSLNPRFKPRGR